MRTQVCSSSFYLKTLPLFDGGDDVGMVLSPQCFHNLNMHADIFNHSNVHFWEYMQPGACSNGPSVHDFGLKRQFSTYHFSGGSLPQQGKQS